MALKLFRTTLSNQIVDLDGNEFDEVTFQNCKMRYSAITPFKMAHCHLYNCVWELSGHASETVGFLKTLWDGMGELGRDLVSDVFAQITDGAMGQRAANATPPILMLEHQPPTLMLTARDGLMH